MLCTELNLIEHISVEREALSDIANVYNYQTFVETDKAGYIIRQWVASNLYDRIRYEERAHCCCCTIFIEYDGSAARVHS